MNEHLPLYLTREDSILIATFNRPEKLNAMNVELMTLLNEAIDLFRDSAELKVMLIRSKGRYFSAGADLKDNSDVSEIPSTGSGIREMHRRLPTRMRQIWDEMEAIEKPFVVAHHARCVGGSLEMSLSCDFRLAAASASYSFPEAKFGILPATNGVSRLVRLVGPHWARWMITANMPVDAEEARTMGLVHKVFPDDSFDKEVMGFCRHLALQNSEMVGASKIAIELAADLPAHQAASVERLVNSSLMLGEGYQKLMTAHVASIGNNSR